MAVSALSAGKRLGERSGWTLSNLAMQKLLYIAHMFHLGKYDAKPLVSGQFEAWDYGPVHPALYHAVKQFGADPVQNIFHSVPPIGEGTETSLLDAAVDQLSDSTSRLVAIAHWKNGAWAKNYIPGKKGVPIPDEDIRQEYIDRQNGPQQSATKR